MSFGRTFEESLLKSIRSLENKVNHLELKSLKDYCKEAKKRLKTGCRCFP